MIRFRTAIQAVPGYVAGRQGSAADALNEDVAQLASNESPFPPLPSVRAAIERSVAGVNRYPDIDGCELRGRLADIHGVQMDQVVLGCGSVEVCRQAVTVAAESGNEVVHAWPTFPEYGTIAALAGAEARRVPLTRARHDLVAIAAAVTEQTRVVFVCNPNNPTGTAVSQAELAELLARIPPWCLVVVDEAYAEFASVPGFGSALGLLGRHENLLVLKTFSKAYGLAGLRVGYGITSTEVASLLSLAKVPFSVSSLALAAATASLDASAELAARVATLRAERDKLVAQLTGLGWEVPPSQANFVWIAADDSRATAATRLCADKRVLVRQLPGGLRVTIGTEEDNARLLDALGSSADLPPASSATEGPGRQNGLYLSGPLRSSKAPPAVASRPIQDVKGA
ncbi:MAG: histidinol-phosphate transaminase [Acidimicrobiales bacterium]